MTAGSTVARAAARTEPEIVRHVPGEGSPAQVAEVPEVSAAVARAWFIKKLRILWERRRFVARAALAGLLAGGLLAFALPKRYESTTQLMPPDDQSGSGLALLAGLTAASHSLGSSAGDVLGMKSSGALFIGILRSRTVEDGLVNRFELGKVYRTRLRQDAREELQENTAISEDRKSGIITIAVTDGSPQRAAGMAQEYVEELNRVVTELNTSSAHRERVFLEERLAQVKQNLESAEKGFSEFASKNSAIDIQEQGKAMIESAATLEGQSVAAQTELEGLKQIYTGDNVRVRTIQARVDELDRQLQKLGGKSDAASAPAGAGDPSTYPSIRELPLLGVRYTDLYTNSELVDRVEEVQHVLARQAMLHFDISRGLEIVSIADIPAGTGLGSSSSYLVGLLNALHALAQDQVNPQRLAEEACRIELDLLRKPIGKQDQYMAAFGGLTVLEIARDGKVNVSRLKLSLDLVEALEHNMLLFYTHDVRDATTILRKQDDATRQNERNVVASLREIKDIGIEICSAIAKGNLRRFGELMDVHWESKKRLAKGITNPQIDAWYELAKTNGAIGGKISGAGGGGFLMFYCEEKKAQVREAMRKARLRELNFRFDFEGSKVIFDAVSRDGRLAHIERQSDQENELKLVANSLH